MDFAHMAYASTLLAVAAACAFMASNGRRGSMKWGLLGTAAAFVMVLELFRMSARCVPELKLSAPIQDAMPLGCCLAFWEFARLCLKERSNLAPGRWSLAIPALLPIAALLAPGGDEAFQIAVWLCLSLPCGLVAAESLARSGEASQRRAALALAIFAPCMALAGLGGAPSQELLAWGWAPALPLGALAAALLAASLWTAYSDEEPEFLARLKLRRGNAIVLALILAGILAASALTAWNAENVSLRTVKDEIEKDMAFIAASCESDTAAFIEKGDENRGLRLETKLESCSSRLHAEMARILLCDMEKGKVETLAIRARKPLSTAAGKEDEWLALSMATDSNKNGGEVQFKTVREDGRGLRLVALARIQPETPSAALHHSFPPPPPPDSLPPHPDSFPPPPPPDSLPPPGQFPPPPDSFPPPPPDSFRAPSKSSFLEARIDEAKLMTLPKESRLHPLIGGFLLWALACALFAIFRKSDEAKASILESEREKENALWGAGAGAWKLDMTKWRMKISPSCAEMLGYPREKTEWSFKDWLALLHPDDLAATSRKFNCYASGQTSTFESKHRMKRADGAWTWILARGRISARGAGGEPAEVSGTHVDASSSVEAENELRRSQARLESAQKTAKLGIWEIDLSTPGYEITWNEQMSVIFGLQPDAKPSRALFASIVDPEDQEKLRSARERCVETGEPLMGRQFKIRRPDGGVRHLRGEGQMLRDAKGKPAKIEGVVIDVSDYVFAQESLLEKERESRELLENLGDVIARIGPDMKFRYMSPSLANYVAVDPSTLPGKGFSEAGFDDSMAKFWEATVASCLASGAPMEREFSYRTLKGEKAFNWRLFPELAPDGKAVSVLSISRDVTKRKEAESAFRDVFNNMLEGFAMCEPAEWTAGRVSDFRTLAVNPAFERLCGKGASQLLNRPASETLPGLGPEWFEAFAQALNSEKPVSFEGEMPGIDRRFEVSAYKSAGSKFAIILYDITERSRAAAELQRQMRLMRAVLDGMPDMLVLMRPDRSILACNKAARSCMGWSDDDDLSSCRCHSLMGLAEPCQGGCACEEALRTGLQAIRDVESAETGRSYEIRAIPINAEDGKAELVVEVIRDNTEKNFMERDLDKTIDSLQAEILQRMSAEEAMRRSEKLHRMITEAAQVGIWQLEADGRIKYMNPRMRELIELPPNEPLEGKSCGDFVPESRGKAFEEAKDRHESFIHSYESELKGANGAKRAVLVSGVVLYLPGTKKLDAYIETFTDITEIRKAEREAELRNLKLMQTEKMASLGILVSGVAHEINNPTNFIMLNAPILHDVWKSSVEALDARAKADPSFALAGLPYGEMKALVPELFKSVSDGAERIKNIVAGLKDYARQEISDPYATTSVNEAVKASLVLLANMVKKSTRDFKIVYGEGLPQIRGAKQKIEQVVINLVQNSCQALRGMDDKLEIRTSFEDGRVKVVVKDGGCGIPKENMPFISDPFFTTKRDSGGTGLGLSISAGIVNELGGEMNFESEPGKGTTATVSFPPASASPS